MQENNRKPNNSQHDLFGALRTLRKSISIQALLAISTVILTVVLLFSLTVAWYTNIVQTGGLTFETEQWSFDGTIHVNNQTYTISPGDEGVVSFSVSNTGEYLVAASVTVQKDAALNAVMDIQTGLPADTMNKRLYFYVDTPATRNGERMDRVYVSANSSYTYTIYPNSTLMLEETIHNGPQLKWEWVYDVLGYYVVGTKDASGNVTAQEYIRPIVYEYDETKTTFSSGIWLATTDGKKTVEQFLYETSSKDGYAGVITAQTPVSKNGYYAVSVDESGYGVWAYLCTLQEIEANMQYDTLLSGSNLPYSAVIRLTGQNSRENALPIENEAELYAALATSEFASVRLTKHMELSAPLALTSGQMLSIDMDTYTLSYLGEDPIITAQVGSQVLLSDGTIKGNGANIGIYSDGGQVTMYDVTMTGINQGIVIRDYLNEIAADSTIHMKECSIYAEEDGVFIHGNADESLTRVIIEDSTIDGRTFSGIYCNGSHYGTDIQVLRSTISGYYTAVYHPQPYSIMTLVNSTLTGQTAVVIKGGTVHINSCTISGTGEGDPPEYQGSGFSNTGDGVYLEANYTWETTINISGACQISSAHGHAVRKFEENVPHAKINISGGMYTTNVSQYCMPGYAVIEDLTATSPYKYTVTVAPSTGQ